MTHALPVCARPAAKPRMRAFVFAATVLLPALLLVTGALLLTPAAHAISFGAGYQWYWLNPSPQGNGIAGIDFAGATRGWAVGDAGTILTTADQGASWKPQVSGTLTGLTSVSFPTTSQGWAVGYDGLVLHTTDGGKHWASQESGTTEPLNGVAFADTTHGWAVGGSWSTPVLLATRDGGKHWEPQSSPANNELRAVDCVDPSHAWAVGVGGALMYTADGGLNWELRYLNGSSSPSFSAVDFSDGLRGWAVDQWGAVATTTDGGESWQEVAQDVATYGVTDVATNGSRVWVTGHDGLVLARDAGGGDSWAAEDTGLGGDLYAATTCGTGVVVGGYAGQMATSTGTGSWVTHSHGIDGEFMGVACTDAQHAWVAGMKGGGESVALIYATLDGGRTWVKQLEDDPMNWLGDVAMADAQRGWAVGWGGGIVTTADGSSWTPQVTPTWPATNYDGVACGDAQHVVAVGYPGNSKNLSSTGDGGSTWTTPASGVTGELRDVTFGDAGHAWAVGNGGIVTASADGGASWTPQASGVTVGLRAVDFIDALTGWAAGEGGVILHTTNGGEDWVPQASGTDSAIEAIRFLTPLKGWAVTSTSEILQTTDGGASWGDAGPRCAGVLHDLAVVDATHAMTVGSWGAVLGMDVVKPVVKATAPRRVQRRSARVRFRATDSQSGVASIQYRVGRGAWKTGSSVKVTRKGSTVVRYRATDGAGNTSAVRKVTVRVRR